MNDEQLLLLFTTQIRSSSDEIFFTFKVIYFFLFIIPHQTIVFFSRFLYNININIPHAFDYFSLEILIARV